jgi:hypothetical protein
MFRKNAIGAVAVAVLLVLAGCSSAVPGSTTQVQSTTAGTVDGGGSSTADAVDLTFYVSDRPGAIEDFEHLNVTITRIGLHEAGDAAEDGDDVDADDTESANDTTASDANAAFDSVETTTVDDPNETTVDVTETEDDESEENESEDDEESDDDDGSEGEASDDAEADSEDDDAEEKDGWVMHDVDSETVDLTELQGANATAISNVSVPAGEYDKVFVYVSDVNATLNNGESVNVKLPSSKLQLTKSFTVSANSSPDFVFDINVHKAGNSGKYILRPIVSESGTGDQVEIEKVDKNGKPENPGNSAAKGNEEGGDDSDDDESDDEETEEAESDESEGDARALEATLDGDVRAGETVTLSVTDANGSVANASVEVNGETVGETGADGTLAFEVPDTEELEVEVTAGDAEVELERKIKGGNGNGGGNDGGYGSAQQLSGHAFAAV